MKKFLVSTILFAILCNVYAAEKSVPLGLQKAEKAIRSFLEKRNIKADFVYKEKGVKALYVKYKTQTYTVRSLGKDGKEFGRYFKQEGPEADGFLLKVFLQDAMSMHSAMMMQIRKHAHWKSFCFTCRFNNEKKFCCNFLFGKNSPVAKGIAYVLGDLDKPEDNLRIYVGNENYKKQDIEIQIKLDNKILVNQLFKPREFGQFVYFSYKVPTGKHKLEISSSKIKTVSREFEFDEKISLFINCYNGNRFNIQMRKYSFDINKLK